MKRKLSRLFADTRSVEKIIVRTSCPWLVPNDVLITEQRAPPLGVAGKAEVEDLAGDDGRADPFTSAPLEVAEVGPDVTCNAFVPLNRTEFLCRPPSSMDKFVLGSSNSIDSLRSGVDSPESIASLTITVPCNNRRSAGIAWSVVGRAKR